MAKKIVANPNAVLDQLNLFFLQDQKFMKMAIKEARKSKAEDKRIHPKVGVVIVKGDFQGRAFRGEKGAGEHAEYTALERKYPRKSIAGATVYVTLEPCTTRKHPKTPCVEWLIVRKVGRVVIGMLDPNPQICGKGIRRLRDANIAVDLFPPELMAEVEELNREFIHEYETVLFRVPIELNRGAGANLINPHYSNDCQHLDDSDFDLRTVINHETILIVVGDGLAAALVDNPVAGMLRDEIDRFGGGRAFRRAVLIGCNRWLTDTALKAKKYPTISIGGSAANQLTDIIVKLAEASKSIWPAGKGGFGAFIKQEKPRVALWGDTAAENRAAVEHYINSADGLASFLKMCWK